MKAKECILTHKGMTNLGASIFKAMGFFFTDSVFSHQGHLGESQGRHIINTKCQKGYLYEI